jgi:ribosomal protein S27AE
MVQCSNCGTECGPDAKFCPNCGQSTLVAARSVTTKMFMPQPASSDTQRVACAECRQDITPADGPYVTVNNNNYHSKCFKCQVCLNPITGTYGTKDGKRVCDRCAPARRGFVVDPITGEKKEAKPKPLPNKAKK